MSDRVRKIWNGITTAIVVLLVALTLLVMGTKIAGFQVFTVLSGSMEPEYPVGSLIWVKPVDPSELKQGDIITFRLEGGTVVTHRILEVAEDASGLRFRTKGDANNAPDGAPVQEEHIIGTPVLTLPLLGYGVRFMKSPAGIWAALSAGAVLLLLMLLPETGKRAQDP